MTPPRANERVTIIFVRTNAGSFPFDSIREACQFARNLREVQAPSQVLRWEGTLESLLETGSLKPVMEFRP